MFVLRQIHPSGCQRNTFLGSSYKVISKNDGIAEFTKLSKEFWNEEDPVSTYAFIITDTGVTIPLYMEESTYIMTEGGKTFDNLSHR